MPQVDYAALAEQARQSAPVDYSGLAAQARGNAAVTPYGGKTLAERQAESKAAFDAAQSPWYSRFFNQAGLDKAKEQAGNVIAGIPQAVSGIPATVVAAKDALNAAIGFGQPRSLATAERMATSMTDPVMTPLKQALELAKPGLVNAPTPDAPETAAAAQGAGAFLGGAAIGEAAEGFPTASKVAAATPDALRAAGNIVTSPDALMARAAANRTPLPKANLRTVTGDVATTAVGYGIAGKEGAAVAEALNLVRRSPMFRNAKAAVQEAAARMLAGQPGVATGVAETAAPVGIAPGEGPVAPAATAADEASRIAQVPVLPREPFHATPDLSGTKAVDAAGNPKTLYHGTYADFNGPIQPGASDMSPTRGLIWFASKEGTSAEAGGTPFGARWYGPNVKKVYLNIKNPMMGDIDALHAEKIGPAELKAQGYDGFYDKTGGSGFWAVVDPSQVIDASGKVNISRPGTPEFIQQQLADARLQGTHENYPGYGDLKPPAEPSAEIPMPNPPEPGVPPAVTDRTITQVKQQLAPSAPGAKMSVGRYTPRLLAEMPELADQTLHGAYNQPAFDAKLFDGFKQREADVIAAEDKVPDGTLVVKKPIMNTIQESIDAAEKYANPKLTNSLERLKSTWEDLPDNIKWPDFIAAKRAFFDANSGNSYLVRQIYRSLTDATSEASPELAAANKSYSVVRQAVDDAGIIRSGPAAGQRIRAQGVRPKPSMFDQFRQSVASPLQPMPATSAPVPPAPPVESTVAMPREVLGRVGANLGGEPRGLTQMIDARLRQFKGTMDAGATQSVGKVLGRVGPESPSANYGTESTRSGGGGIFQQFPELEKTGDAPGAIQDAIRRHEADPSASNVVYDRVRKVVADAMQASRESRPESGPGSLFQRFQKQKGRIFDSQPPF